MKYSKEQIEAAIKTSYSIAETLTKLNLKPSGGNYKTIHVYVKLFNLDTSHFTGMLWNKGKTIGPKRPVEDYLTNKVYIHSHTLKLRLIKEGIFKHKCYDCHLSEWKNNPIPIELHHIDGNPRNNNLSNLQLLCPNCHALTENYSGKSKRKLPIPNPKEIIDRYSIYPKRKKKYYFCQCGNTMRRRSKICAKCHKQKLHTFKINWPSPEEMAKLIQVKSMVQIGKELGVTDNAIKKHYKPYNLPFKPRGHWAKAYANK